MYRLHDFIILVAGLFGLLVLGACQSATTPPEVAVIEALEAAIDAQDLDAIVALYDEDGIIQREQYRGSKQIRNYYNVFYIIPNKIVDNTNIRLEDEKVFFEHTYMDSNGKITSRELREAVIENGKIKTDLWVDSLPFISD